MNFLAGMIAGLGVPGLILVGAMALSGLSGAAAITAALAAIGPGGMLGGLATLGTMAALMYSLGEAGISRLFKLSVETMIKNGETYEGIKEKINGYLITPRLKKELVGMIDTEQREYEKMIEGGLK